MTDPMMWEYIRDAAKIKHSIAKNRARREEEEDNSEQEEEAPMLTLDEEIHALVTLWDCRAELAREAGPEDNAFSFTLRGVWTATHVGVASHSYRAFPAAGRPRLFCANYALAQTCTFSISKFGDELCLALCRAWIHRMSFLYHV